MPQLRLLSSIKPQEESCPISGLSSVPIKYHWSAAWLDRQSEGLGAFHKKQLGDGICPWRSVLISAEASFPSRITGQEMGILKRLGFRNHVIQSRDRLFPNLQAAENVLSRDQRPIAGSNTQRTVRFTAHLLWAARPLEQRAGL